LAQQNPEAARGSRGRGAGPLLAGREKERAKNRKKCIFLFSFLFRIFKSIFQMIFKSNLNLMQTTQHKTPNAAA
jgi:hypothetical protein